MYIVEIYEQTIDNDGLPIYELVGNLKGKFLTKEQAQLKIDNETYFCKKNFTYRIVEV